MGYKMTYNEMLTNLHYNGNDLSVSLKAICKVNLLNLTHEEKVLAIAFYNKMVLLVENIGFHEHVGDWDLCTKIVLRDGTQVYTGVGYPEIRPVMNQEHREWDDVVSCLDHPDISEIYIIQDFDDNEEDDDGDPIRTEIKISDIVELGLGD